MFKNIIYIYWMKLAMFPIFVNNAFYYFIKIKLKYMFINLVASILSLINIITYPIVVFLNMFKLLIKRIKNDDDYYKMQIKLNKYYLNSKREILSNRRNIEQIISEV